MEAGQVSAILVLGPMAYSSSAGIDSCHIYTAKQPERPALFEKAVRQESMNKKAPPAAIESGILTAPAFPKPGHQILHELHQRLNLAEGYDINFERLRTMFGLPKSTIGNWLTHIENPVVQLLFGLLERLPEGERRAFIDNHCRTFPTLEHASLAHEPAIVDHLRALLGLSAGLTLIASSSEYARHFLLSSFGHSFCRLDPEHRTVAGMVCKSPGHLVPCCGVFYLAGEMTPKMLLHHVNRLWPDIRDAATPLVLLDGVWNRVPNKRADIVKLAQSKHVVLADEIAQDESSGLKGSLLTRLEVSGSPASTLHVHIRRRIPSGYTNERP